MNRRVAVRGIIMQGDHILALRLKHYKESLASDTNDFWCTPGGGVDIGEPLVDALERELIEELGIKPIVGQLLYIQQFIDTGTEHLEFFFQILNPNDYEHVDLDTTTHGNIEIEELGFIDPKTTHVLPAFLQTEDIARHEDTDTAVKIFSNT